MNELMKPELYASLPYTPTCRVNPSEPPPEYRAQRVEASTTSSSSETASLNMASTVVWPRQTNDGREKKNHHQSSNGHGSERKA